MKSNPNTFAGTLDQENLYVVLSQQDIGIGGMASDDFESIEIEERTITNAASDAELTVDICHELTHVFMRHIRKVQTGRSGQKLDFTNNKGPEHYFKMVSGNANYATEKLKLDAFMLSKNSIAVELNTINEQQAKVVKIDLSFEMPTERNNGDQGVKKGRDFLSRCKSTACQTLKELSQKPEILTKERFELHSFATAAQEYAVYIIIAALIPGEVFLTWAEREADEVGLEFCARAGFNTEALEAIPKR